MHSNVSRKCAFFFFILADVLYSQTKFKLLPGWRRCISYQFVFISLNEFTPKPGMFTMIWSRSWSTLTSFATSVNSSELEKNTSACTHKPIHSKASVYSPGTVVGADFDVIIGECVVSDRNLARAILITHKTLSESEIKVCLLS